MKQWFVKNLDLEKFKDYYAKYCTAHECNILTQIPKNFCPWPGLHPDRNGIRICFYDFKCSHETL